MTKWTVWWSSATGISPEFGMLSMWQWFERPEYPEWEAAWSGM